MNIGKIIKAEREKLGVTIKEVAHCIKIEYESLWTIENYSSGVSLNTLTKLCDYYGLDKRAMAEINFKNGRAYREYKKYIDTL